MKDSTVNRVVRKTTDYSMFQLIGANRDLVEGHVAKLKKALQETGNLTEVTPIIVNEKYEIIDGQNRFEACKQLELPIFYVEIEGLTIHDARQMNILHRNWINSDYAKSYAATGDQNYQRFLVLVEEFGFSYGVTMTVAQNGKKPGMHQLFRNGEFVLAHEDMDDVRARLEQLSQVREVIGSFTDTVAQTLIGCFKQPGYEHKRMLKKLAMYKHQLRSYKSLGDNQRQFEEIYNYNQPEAHRVRLY